MENSMKEDQTLRYKSRLIEIIERLDTLESITINFTADHRNTFYEIQVRGHRLGPIEPEEMKIEKEEQHG